MKNQMRNSRKVLFLASQLHLLLMLLSAILLAVGDIWMMPWLMDIGFPMWIISFFWLLLMTIKVLVDISGSHIVADKMKNKWIVFVMLAGIVAVPLFGYHYYRYDKKKSNALPISVLDGVIEEGVESSPSTPPASTNSVKQAEK